MRAPATEPRLACERHDAVLLLALGALRLSRRLESSLCRPSGAAPLDRDDPAVLAALGAVSLGRTLRRWLEAAATDAPVPAEHPAAHRIPPELLR